MSHTCPHCGGYIPQKHLFSEGLFDEDSIVPIKDCGETELRDQFAMAALPELINIFNAPQQLKTSISIEDHQTNKSIKMATLAYKIADAMLEARK